MVYTVTFNPAIDYVVRVDDFETGKLNRTRQELIQIGGKGINVSVLLSRLGVETTALGFVAGFTGQEIERTLEQECVRTDFVHLKQGFTRINVKLKGGQETEINGRGPQVDEASLEALHEKLQQIREGDYLVLAGSVPADMPKQLYSHILEKLSRCGAGFVVDAEGELLTGILQYRPFLIKPNHLELGAIFHKELHGEEEIEACAAQLQKQGARNVLVSMGGAGAILLDESGLFHRAQAPDGTVKNSVGAGDSMVAGFLAGWLRFGDYERALRMGIAAGSATAFSYGLAEREEVMALLETF